MDWRKAMLLGVLLLETGCPEEWGKGGVIDRAVAKDTRAKLPEMTCPEGKTGRWICPPDEPDSEKCEWLCI